MPVAQGVLGCFLMLNVPRQIVWAVDAFEPPESPLVRATANWIAGLIRDFGTRVEPIYVLNPAELNLTSEFSVPWVSRYRPYAEQALAELVRRLDLPGLIRPRVLVQESASTTRAIDALSDYAVASEVDLIVAATHGRSGVKRLLMGSFVETLLLRSYVPVMVIGTESHAPETQPLGKLFLPTDLSEHSKSFFCQVVHLCAETKSELTLFHAVPHPIEPIVSSGVYLLGGGWVPVESYFAEETRSRERRADAWARWASSRGVRVTAVVEHQGVGIAQKAIDVAADKRVGAIIMEAQNGPIASALVGSVTRQIVRHAPCPVWVVGPKARASVLRAAA
jgi:nucleotide-binding universal stress UspA family protein